MTWYVARCPWILISLPNATKIRMLVEYDKFIMIESSRMYKAISKGYSAHTSADYGAENALHFGLRRIHDVG
jgi:hypothetical protein